MKQHFVYLLLAFMATAGATTEASAQNPIRMPWGAGSSADDNLANNELDPAVFPTPDSRELIRLAWIPLPSAPPAFQLVGQREFRNNAFPIGDPFSISETSGLPVIEAGIFVDDLRFVVLWSQDRMQPDGSSALDETFFYRLFELTEEGVASVTGPTEIGSTHQPRKLDLAVAPDGGIVYALAEAPGEVYEVFLGELPSAPVPQSPTPRTDLLALGAEVQAREDLPAVCQDSFDERLGNVDVTATGEVLVTWARSVSGDCSQELEGLYARRFDLDLDPLGDEVELETGAPGQIHEVASHLALNGNLLVIRNEANETIRGRWYGADLSPLSGDFLISTGFDVQRRDPRIVELPDEQLFVTWQSAMDLPPAGFEEGRLIRRLWEGCGTSTLDFCLGAGDRFRVEAQALGAQGRLTFSTVNSISVDTGYLTFFNFANVELIVKVLDGSANNGNFWVFYGALSNVRYRLIVTDMERGLQKVYENPARNFASVGDTAAFPGDGNEPLASAATVPTGMLTPAEIAALLPDPPEQALGLKPALVTAGGSNETLTFVNGRFEATIDWRDQRDRTGTGQGAMLTEDTGYFWFFRPENVEVVVKVLDGRRNNGHWWVFYGALTNVEWTLTVTDTSGGATKEYFNPLRTFASDGDTRAFEE